MLVNSVIVRGGGDIATGTIQKLHRSGFKVLVLETEKPTSIRRTVCFSEAVYDGQAIVEGDTSVLVKSKEEILEAWEKKLIPIAVDNDGTYIDMIKPEVVVDGILAKRNLGTNKSMAPITVALGPGFCAGKDVDVVIETMRGHNLGRLIFDGFAEANTGVPGEIGGHSKERVIYSPAAGIIQNIAAIGEVVEINSVIASIEGIEVKTTIAGILRGIIRDGSYVKKGLKIADVDPRLSELNNYNSVSDKARSIGGGVLEAILFLSRMREDR